EPPKDKPRGLLGDVNLFGQLHGRDALTRRHEQVHRVNPLVQRNLGPLEDGARSNSEVKVAGVAVVEAFSRPGRNPLRFAIGTNRAIRPQPAFQILAGAGFVREGFEEFESAYGALAHVSIVAEYSANVNCTHVYNSQKRNQWFPALFTQNEFVRCH